MEFLTFEFYLIYKDVHKSHQLKHLYFLLFYLIGVSAVYFNNDVNYKDYYQNYAEKNSTIVLRVDKVLKYRFMDSLVNLPTTNLNIYKFY